MKIKTLKGTNLDLTDTIKQYISEKLDGLDKLSIDFGESVSADVEVCKESHHHQKGPHFHCAITMAVPGAILRAEERAEDLYASIDSVRDKLHRQLSDFKVKLSDRSHRGKRPGKN